MNILIIEDEKRNFNLLKRLLEEMDGTFRIDGPLASIVEAVEWLQTHPAPNLILADIRLSDGLSFPDFITFFNFSYKPALQVSVAAFFSLIWVTHGNFVSSCYVCA